MATNETNQDKLKALQLTLDKIEKNFGKGSVMKLGENVVENIPAIPTIKLRRSPPYYIWWKLISTTSCPSTI